MGDTKCVQNVMLVSQNAQLNCLASVLIRVSARVAETIIVETRAYTPRLVQTPLVELLIIKRRISR